MPDHIWVLGATGRVGRAVAARLDTAGAPLVLAGRDGDRLHAVAPRLAGTPRLVVGSLEAALTALAQAPVAVVINTIGPFTTTAVTVARACPPGSYYADVSNELGAVQAILDLDAEARAAGSTLVSAAGFGVLATESVVLQLCAEQPPARRVRVDAAASVVSEPGVIGPALAASIIGGLPVGGREVRHGRLVRSRLLAEPQRLSTPDGDTVSSPAVPSGELLAVRRAAGRLASQRCRLGPGRVRPGSHRRPGEADHADRRRDPADPAGEGVRDHQTGHAYGHQLGQPRASSPGHTPTSNGNPAQSARDGSAPATPWISPQRPPPRSPSASRAARVAPAYTPGVLFGPELALAAGCEFVMDPHRGATADWSDP